MRLRLLYYSTVRVLNESINKFCCLKTLMKRKKRKTFHVKTTNWLLISKMHVSFDRRKFLDPKVQAYSGFCVHSSQVVLNTGVDDVLRLEECLLYCLSSVHTLSLGSFQNGILHTYYHYHYLS